MNRKWTYSLAALALSLAVAGAGCEKLKARDQLNKGVQAFRNAKYAEAVERFKTAVQLDPTFPVARLYLATAYMSQYIPGAESPDNLKMAAAAKENFLKVLEQDPRNEVALASMASLHYQEAGGIQDLDAKMAKLDEAREWYLKLVDVSPSNKEAYYSLGVIAWAKWYPAFAAARSKAGMKPEDPGPLKDKKAREELREKYWTMIEEGLQNLNKALEIDSNYDEAMAYINLLYRQRADLAENQKDYQADIAEADKWLEKALNTRKMKAGVASAESAEPAQ
ncbi:MAG TPA: tetratricopeptide repeat protein [Bryobacteraceae bacterium]|nr:tetratricopeptide repeat protein [Bryobacteraceae bacterium]HOQ43891.1 tetratricopeptide repeat protein [Bryobacteraceae bacterium]HPU71666.1 tetratricopeptide repeat protein [Bryobacteraceae bacterium]